MVIDSVVRGFPERLGHKTFGSETLSREILGRGRLDRKRLSRVSRETAVKRPS